MRLTKKILAITLSSAVAFSSCADFLEEKPTTSITKKEAYSSESGIAGLMVGVYATTASVNASNLWMLLTQASGPTLYRAAGRSGLTVDQKQAIELDYRSNTGSVLTGWLNSYTAINRANNIISELTKVNDDGTPFYDELDPEFVNHILGNAYYLRAVNYFNLVRVWGPLPLRTTPTTGRVDFPCPRSGLKDVYELIVDDLEMAFDMMQEKGEMRTAWPDQAGYPHRWAAKALLAKVYLQMGCIKMYPGEPFEDPHFSDDAENEYTAQDLFYQALYAAEEVINEGVYRLLPLFSDVFYAGRQNTSEGIFETQASVVSGSSPQCLTYGVPNQCTKYATTTNSVAGRVRPMHELFQAFNPGDPRRSATFIYDSYIKYVDDNPPTIFAVYPAAGASANNDGGFPYFRKNFDSLYDALGSNTHFYIMRYADLYLIASEAANEVGESEKAVEYINVIRRRARDANGNGNPNDAGEIHPVDMTAYPGIDAFRGAVMTERLLEFAGENHEWFDTRRRGVQGFIDRVSTPHNYYKANPDMYGTNVKFNVIPAAYSEFPTEYNMVKYKLLLPIPMQELMTNSAIPFTEQNPGY